MAPASYRYRLIAQFVLCGLLFISSCIYTVLYFVHARRRGQQFWLVRLQQPWEATSLLKSKHNSKRIVLNNLPFCSILMIAASIGAFWRLWRTAKAANSRQPEATCHAPDNVVGLSMLSNLNCRPGHRPLEGMGNLCGL